MSDTTATEVRSLCPALFLSMTEKEAQEKAEEIAESWNSETPETKEKYLTKERKFNAPEYSYKVAQKSAK
ncbi:hypothetical protein BGX31_001470 [Mortierella sp. GBA43]|nr:hypothetical protein BGX31_001470 [Mortierella sp. GBA43]